MPLQNRVTPTGEIVAHPGRGLLMGNRGCLHNLDHRLGNLRWRSKLWISCTLTWKDVRREPMPPGRWTALFFLDEPTALAAGHRPCAFCRRADYLSYAHAWQAAYGLAERPRAVELDARLHAERVALRPRRQRTWSAAAGPLPDATMVRLDGSVGLLRGGTLLPWSFTGYRAATPVRPRARVEVLTPPSSVAALRHGFRPLIHPTAAQGCDSTSVGSDGGGARFRARIR
jgi:hypothetical protein